MIIIVKISTHRISVLTVSNQNFHVQPLSFKASSVAVTVTVNSLTLASTVIFRSTSTESDLVIQPQ